MEQIFETEYDYQTQPVSSKKNTNPKQKSFDVNHSRSFILHRIKNKIAETKPIGLLLIEKYRNPMKGTVHVRFLRGNSCKNLPIYVTKSKTKNLKKELKLEEQAS